MSTGIDSFADVMHSCQHRLKTPGQDGEVMRIYSNSIANKALKLNFIILRQLLAWLATLASSCTLSNRALMILKITELRIWIALKKCQYIRGECSKLSHPPHCIVCILQFPINSNYLLLMILMLKNAIVHYVSIILSYIMTKWK